MGARAELLSVDTDTFTNPQHAQGAGRDPVLLPRALPPVLDSPLPSSSEIPVADPCLLSLHRGHFFHIICSLVTL